MPLTTGDGLNPCVRLVHRRNQGPDLGVNESIAPILFDAVVNLAHDFASVLNFAKRTRL